MRGERLSEQRRRIINWTTWSVAAALTGGAVWLLVLSGSPVAVRQAHAADPVLGRPQPAAEALDVPTYTRIASLREAMSLDDLTLGAAGVSEAGVRTILGNLKTWYTQNQQQLATLDAQVRTAQASVETLSRQVNVGPKQPSTITQLEQAIAGLDQAFQQRTQVLDSAAATLANSGTTAQQSQTLTLARVNRGVGERYRFLSLGATDRKKLLGQSSGKVDAAVETQATQVASAVTANRAQSMPGVLAASASVLPVPAELLVEPPPEPVAANASP